MNKFVILLLLVAVSLSAQDFGFGFDDENGGGSVGNAVSVKVGGEVSAEIISYIDDFSKGADHIRLGNIFSGKLKFSAGTSFTDGIINLKLSTTEQPISFDEAYIRAYFGNLEIEGGLRKLTWGKADTFGPLDVINPLDYTELTDLGDMLNIKMPVPLSMPRIALVHFQKSKAYLSLGLSRFATLQKGAGFRRK